MSNFLSKTNKLATKLIRETNSGKLEWEMNDPPVEMTEGTDDFIPLFFKTKYKDKWIAIFENRYQGIDLDTESLYWTKRIVLAVLDSENRVLWESRERSPALNDLLDTVREKYSGIDDLLSDLIDE